MKRGALTLAMTVAVLLAGTAGTASAMFTQLQRVSKASAESSAAKSITVPCPAGTKVVGAGADVTPGAGDVLIQAIRPNATLTSVTVAAREDEDGTAANWYVAAYATCAPPPAGLERVAATSAASSAAKPVVATCPSGKSLLGGAAELGNAYGQVLLDGIVPNLANRNVTVDALEDETGTAGSWTITAYAICSSPVTGLVRVSATSPVDSTGSRVVTAPCPVGKSLISMAGTINSPNGQGVLDAVFPDEALTTAGFAAWEDDTGNSADWSATAYGICAPHAHLAWSQRVRQQSTGRGRGSACPAGEEVLQPGAEVTGALGQAWITGEGYGELIDDPNNRRAFFANADPDETGAPTSWALDIGGLCATPIAGAEVVSAVAPSTSNTVNSVTVPCPSGKKVLGAGYDLYSAANEVRMDRVRPDPTLSMVTVGGHEDSTGDSGTWTVAAYALCAPAPPGLQRVAVTTPPASGEVTQLSAACPAGKHMVGTGAEIAGGNGQVGFDDLRPNSALTRTLLTATEDEIGLAADWSATAYAICVNR